MNLWRPVEPIPPTPALDADLARICALWGEARRRYGQAGPFLFGTFSNADAMFAPVATRIRTYALPVDATAQAYVETVHAMPAFRRWQDAALRESWLIPHDERDWPEVKRVPLPA